MFSDMHDNDHSELLKIRADLAKLRAELADRDTELASIRRHLGGHPSSQLDGANGLAQATYSAMRRAEADRDALQAKLAEAERELEALREYADGVLEPGTTVEGFGGTLAALEHEMDSLLGAAEWQKGRAEAAEALLREVVLLRPVTSDEVRSFVPLLRHVNGAPELWIKRRDAHLSQPSPAEGGSV
jgi:chromosome segregation ATPase